MFLEFISSLYLLQKKLSRRLKRFKMYLEKYWHFQSYHPVKNLLDLLSGEFHAPMNSY